MPPNYECALENIHIPLWFVKRVPSSIWLVCMKQLVQGDADHVLQREMADCHDTICSDLTVKLVGDSAVPPILRFSFLSSLLSRHIPNSSHWVQQDVPDLCNQYMTDFLSTKSVSM